MKYWVTVIVGIVAIAGIWFLMDEGRENTQGQERFPVNPHSGQGPESIPHVAQVGDDVGVYPDVWTKNGYDGPSFEYKVNCAGDFPTLEECFLWDMDRLTVTNPTGDVTDLEKDFNINAYSGEVTRRWVVYGEPDAGFPVAGTYLFTYYRNGVMVHEHALSYEPDLVDAPSDISWERIGTDLHVTWTPPIGMTEEMWYKVILFRDDGSVISQVAPWNASEAVLENVPLDEGQQIDMNVSSYFPGGYAYPENVDILWTSAP